MPKSKLRKSRKPLLRKQIVMTAPTKLFVELYFTKRALEFKKKFSRRKKLTDKEIAQSAPKNRYRLNPDAIPFIPENKVKVKVIMHRRY